MNDPKLPPGKALPVRISGIKEGAYTEDDEQEYQKYLDGLAEYADEIAKEIKAKRNDASR